MPYSRYFVGQQLGDPLMTIADLQQQLARGDTTFNINFGAYLGG